MMDSAASLALNLGNGFLLMLVLNVLLLIFTPRIIEFFGGDELDVHTRESRTNLLLIASVVLALVLLGFVLSRDVLGDGSIGLKALLVLIIVYLAYVLSKLAASLIRLRYGKRIQSQDSSRIADTYASRALTISAGVFISLVALIIIVGIFGFESLLEAGGVIGFIGVFLGLTQAAWAPDIISGLVILNTRMFEERDVVKLDDGSDEIIARIYRTRAFHTELLNLVDNHRIMIRNSRMRDYTVHNLSRFATARGLRESLRFNIGYDVAPETVRSVFAEAFERAAAIEELEFERQHPAEVRLQDAGDYAIAWSFHYYTKDADSIVALRQAFREIILEVCLERGIDLATPLVISSGNGPEPEMPGSGETLAMNPHRSG